jgi:polyphosphate:AMP phosphotransferase
MSETAGPGAAAAARDAYRAESAALRVDLLNAQFDLRDAGFSALIFLAGDDRDGCEQLDDLLNEWMDTRYLDTRVPERPAPGRPAFEAAWRGLPARGRIGLYLGSWAHRTIARRVLGRIDDNAFEVELRQVRELESTLAADGSLVLKFWVHLPDETARKRLKKARRGTRTGWRRTKMERRVLERPAVLAEVGARARGLTDTPEAPWVVIDGGDRRARNLAVGHAILDALRNRLQARNASSSPASTAPAPEPVPGPAPVPIPAAPRVLATIDLSRSIDYDTYRDRIERLQVRLGRLSDQARRRDVASVVLFEGWDTAGKGGAIRRMTAAMAAANYRVVPIAAPTPHELEYHYLRRFWRALPPPGRMTIFDRSWYGRVLVERVEHFTPEHRWRRGYGEINDFEAQLVGAGIPVLKFWLHIDPDEQLRRLEARARTPYKKYKVTKEDYRNRDRWDDYIVAVEEMIARTSTPAAPWHVIAANDKRAARVEVLQHVCDRLKRAIQEA